MRLLAEAYDTEEKRSFYEYMLALEALKASLDGPTRPLCSARTRCWPSCLQTRENHAYCPGIELYPVLVFVRFTSNAC
ncbi:MAG: hypothetical protein ACOX4M_00795 [Acetivibrionales bacterium]